MTSLEKEEKKSTGKELFFKGYSLKEISEKIGISTNSLSRWCKDGNWQQERAARGITTKELVKKILLQIDMLLEASKDDPSKFRPQEIAMLFNSISKIDKGSDNVVTIIDVFTAYQKWLNERQKIDKNLDDEFISKCYNYQNEYINSRFANSTIN
ncbi:MAG: hypothetical protein MJZ66_02810 [Bacteroidales bacterium]|nr:hypothetical protein [Bacteroidales bacterium]